MRCSSCGFDNREGAKFCNECGAPLVLRCASCGMENQAGAKFCNECGTALTKGEKGKRGKGENNPRVQKNSNSQTLDARPQTLDAVAERRQLTVMFCDLVDSTALSAQLDPEDLREVVRAYQATSTEAVRRYDGHIAQHLGDGLLVYFGYPVAHEDDAVRACCASRVGNY